MKLTIHRCLKKPGLIIRAKTYFVELNDRGLYIIALGNAAMIPPAPTALHEAVGTAAFKHFDRKYEPKILQNEQRIQLGQLGEMVTEKYSYFLRKDEVQEFKVSSFYDSVRMDIKGGKVKISLYAHPEYGNVIKEMARAFGKL